MYLGKIVEIAPSEEIYSNPMHPVHQGAYLRDPEIKKTRREKGEEVSISGEIRKPG